MTKKSVAVVGSRNYHNPSLIISILNQLVSHKDQIIIVSGGADGVDTLAEQWADTNGVEKKIFPADWDTHGKSAGMKRNADIIAHADMVLVFWDGESAGTLDSIKKANSKNLFMQVYLA